MAAPAYAQASDQDTKENAVQATADPDSGEGTESIVVTGSRIRRIDLTSSSPVAVVQDEEFKLSGTVNVEQVINTLPQVLPGTTAFSNNPGGGFATLDLRGLGSFRTLVIVNGRRYMFFDTSQRVDLNTIPAFLLDGVDVVTGGASAVYGSDAIAGVVNFRLRQDLQGIEAGTTYSITDRGDTPRFNAHIAIGTAFADGRGHVTAYAEYYDRDATFAGKRAFSRQVYNATLGTATTPETRGVLYLGGNTTTPQGRFQVAATQTVGAGNNLPAVTLNLGAGTNFGTANGATFLTPNDGSIPYTSANAYNFYPDNLLVVPQERWALGSYGEYEVSKGITGYMEVSFVNNRVQNELAPTPVTGTFGIRTNNPFVTDADRAALAQIDANEAAIEQARFARATAAGKASFTSTTSNVVKNPDGTTTITANQIAQISVNRRVNDINARNALNERNAFRVLAGVKGDLTSNFTYDAYYFYARTRNTIFQRGNISRSAFAAGLLGTAANGGTLDIFGPGTISAASAAAISINSTNLDSSSLQVASASVSGRLFNLGLGAEDIGLAAGVEWRSQSSSYNPDTALSSGDVIGFNGGQPTKGSYNVKEVFGELRVPIIADRPFFNRLEINGAARYSDYSLVGVGNTFTWAAGAEWAPIQDIRFRAQYQRAVRAPNVGELFGGQSQGFPSATDPCGASSPVAGRTATVRSLCEATGVPAANVFQTIVQSNTQLEGRFGGNPNLGEETSDTYTIGAVLRPRFIPGLNITADYFNITVDDYISTLGGGLNNTLNLCYNVIQDVNSIYCQAVSAAQGARNPISGAIGGQFLPNILNANVGALKTSGVDVQVDYTTRLGFGMMSDESRINFFFLGTWTEKNDLTPVADLPTIVNRCAGYFGTTCGNPQPKYKFTSRLSWIDGPVTVSARGRYIGRTKDDRIILQARDPAVIAVPILKPKFYTDLSFSYDVSDQFTFAMGVNNLFDVQPKILPDERDQQSGTYPSVYDVLGRDFFVSARFRF
jgi:outer membrane receptor protein involved in Fe transport